MTSLYCGRLTRNICFKKMCWQEVSGVSVEAVLPIRLSYRFRSFFFEIHEPLPKLQFAWSDLFILPIDRHQSLLERRRITAAFKTFVCHNFGGQIEKNEKLDWKHIPMLCLLCLYLIHRGGFCKGNRTPYHASPPCVLPQWIVLSLPSGYFREIHVNVASYSNQASFHCSCRWRNQNVAVSLLRLMKQLYVAVPTPYGNESFSDAVDFHLWNRR